jgi:hypothetical protein
VHGAYMQQMRTTVREVVQLEDPSSTLRRATGECHQLCFTARSQTCRRRNQLKWTIPLDRVPKQRSSVKAVPSRRRCSSIRQRGTQSKLVRYVVTEICLFFS